jgi:hypothetical protein
MGTSAAGGGGGWSLGSASTPIPPGILTYAGIRTLKTFQPIGDCWWSLHLCYGPNVEDGVFATLTAGYIQWPCSLSWFGNFEIPPDLHLVVECVGDLTAEGFGVDQRVTLTRDDIRKRLYYQLREKAQA